MDGWMSGCGWMGGWMEVGWVVGWCIGQERTVLTDIIEEEYACEIRSPLLLLAAKQWSLLSWTTR